MIQLENGAEVLQMVARGNEAIVLARWGDERVVWHCYKSARNGMHYCEYGQYFRNDPEGAEAAFQKRAKEHMGWQ